MTLTLTPETAARLMAVAAQRRLPPEAALAAVLTEAETDFDEAVAGTERGMDNFDGGCWVSLEDYEVQVKAGRQEREARKRSDPKQAA